MEYGRAHDFREEHLHCHPSSVDIGGASLDFSQPHSSLRQKRSTASGDFTLLCGTSTEENALASTAAASNSQSRQVQSQMLHSVNTHSSNRSGAGNSISSFPHSTDELSLLPPISFPLLYKQDFQDWPPFQELFRRVLLDHARLSSVEHAHYDGHGCPLKTSAADRKGSTRSVMQFRCSPLATLKHPQKGAKAVLDEEHDRENFHTPKSGGKFKTPHAVVG